MPGIGITVDTTGEHLEFGRRLGVERLPVIHLTDDWNIDLLEHGMASGATSIMLLIPGRTGDGEVVVVAETSVQCFMLAATVIAAHCRDEVEQPGWAVLSDRARAALLPRYAEAVRRAVPTATDKQALTAASMIIDAAGADAPPERTEP